MSNENIKSIKNFWNKNSNWITLGLGVAVLGSVLLIMSTFSRNTSTMQGSDTASIAKFEYEIKQTEGQDQLLSSSNPGINIFDTAADAGLGESGGKILAPGTAGYFEFLFRNKSQTPVKVTFDNFNYEEENNQNLTVPIIFYFNGKYYSKLYNQSLDDYYTETGKTGKDWTYYFNEGDSDTNKDGITLEGNMDDFKLALNQFSTNAIGNNDKATSFLSINATTNEDYIKLAWFYPFDARIGATAEAGTDPGSGYKIYSFDQYNGEFISGNVNVKMAPIIRVSQIDEYQTNNKSGDGATDHGYYKENWYRKNKETEANWGED